MNLPFFFRADDFRTEFIILGWLLVFLFILSVIRRFRWNREKLFRIDNGRWFIALLAFTLLYSSSVFLARDVVLLQAERQEITEKVNLFIWQDASKSVLARDVFWEDKKSGKSRFVSRFSLIKMEIDALLPLTLGNNVFYGIFGDEAYVVVPLKYMDKETLAGFRAEIDRITEKTISRMEQGTNIGRALLVTASRISPVITEGKESCLPQIIVILTDGEPVGDQAQLQVDLEQGMFKLRRVPCVSTYIIGVGNPEKSSFIPVLDNIGIPTGEYETDAKGIIATKPNFLFLDAIAKALSGKFMAGRTGNDLNIVLQDVLTKKKRVIGYKEVIKEMLLAWHFAWGILGLLILLNPLRNPFE